MPGEALCLSFPLCDRPTGTRSDPATSTPSWARSPASTLPSCGGEVTNSLDPRQRCCSALGALHAPAMHTHPCSARDAPYVHPGSCTVRGEDAHVRPRTTQEQSPRVPPATCTTAAAPHARPLRAPPGCRPARPHVRKHRGAAGGTVPLLLPPPPDAHLEPPAPCAPTGAHPRCGMFLASALAWQRTRPSELARGGSVLPISPPPMTSIHNDTTIPVLHLKPPAPTHSPRPYKAWPPSGTPPCGDGSLRGHRLVTVLQLRDGILCWAPCPPSTSCARLG